MIEYGTNVISDFRVTWASPNSGDAESIAIIELDGGCHPF